MSWPGCANTAGLSWICRRFTPISPSRLAGNEYQEVTELPMRENSETPMQIIRPWVQIGQYRC
jgi:hypothetical protein